MSFCRLRERVTTSLRLVCNWMACPPCDARYGMQVVVQDGVLSAKEPSVGVSLCRGVRLARDCHEQNAQLGRGADGRLWLQTSKALVAGEELRAWFAVDLLAELDVPILTPAHIRGHQSYVCLGCGASFPQPNPLKAHLMLEHCSGASPRRLRPRRGHVCMFCGKLYSRRYGLKIHVRTHTGYKPLQCRFCRRPFSDPSNLNKHVRLHAELDSPYRCSHCGKVLVRRRDLDRHLRSRHGAALTTT
ncbi:PR domain zinc finger protein 13-like [Ixodes scapularis]|uniref:PR domain zinc finger protein 13-like n=1 Tax=Ixodes scapularis TaxID=6945 RepID=UPI001C3893B9|nr:PR domain zinc finger protein 13-like [Ixodes scapularis]